MDTGGGRKSSSVAVKGGLAEGGVHSVALRLGLRHASRLLQPLGLAALLGGGGFVGLTFVGVEGAGSDKAHQHV